MPSLNEMYKKYGCNQGELVFIMDGMNVYHDKMKAMYQDSLGGIFPMLAVNDNMDSLHFLKKDFPGAAPLYALISPAKEIVYSGRTSSEFFAAVDSMNLKTMPELCDSATSIQESKKIKNSYNPVNVISGNSGCILLDVRVSGDYGIEVFTLNGQKVESVKRKFYNSGRHAINYSHGKGVYLVSVSDGINKIILKVDLTN